jgi:hypothetical protein
VQGSNHALRHRHAQRVAEQRRRDDTWKWGFNRVLKIQKGFEKGV